ncbi:MAG: ATP-dependent zinc metalloprotease FtsH [Cyanobacteria bacterium K_Offshore_surface_m2_239]|nr:ATP-dependent zinc metalloprotease FtsH [Cyanobacteria bacterium K_Offshore_surface_m2_239]
MGQLQGSAAGGPPSQESGALSPAGGEGGRSNVEGKTQSGENRPSGKEAQSERPAEVRGDSPRLNLGFSGSRTTPPSYSQMLESIRQGRVRDISLSPRQRVATLTYADGQTAQVALFNDNQTLLRTAQEQRVPLSVRDERQEEAVASFVGNLLLAALLLGGLALLIRRSSQVASKTLGFGRSQPRVQPEGTVPVRFEDVAGIAEAKEELQEVVTFLKSPERFTSIGAKIPKGVLLVGPPGTGKTLLARAIAGEAGVPFFSMAASEFVELFVGVGASRVRDLFRQAKAKAPCIIFIDEIDAVGRQRGAGIGGGNDEREQTLNQLLTEMDGFEDNSGVILLAATNRPDVLDTALMRPGRFDRRITVDLPDRRGREAILAVHARTRPLDDMVSLADWAARTPGFSGADLSNLLNEAAILTARRQESRIDDRAISDALERITMGLTAAPLQDSAKKRLIAYHEVGHALLSCLVPHASRLDKVTLLPRAGGVAGFARTVPDEDILDSGLISRAYLHAQLVVSLGGRAAELLVFGPSEVTQGAASDLQMVSRICREMVTRYGFSSLGPQALEGDGAEVFLGRDWIRSDPHYSQHTGKRIDADVRSLARQSLDMALAVLAPRRALMDVLVERLIREETIDGDSFRQEVEAWGKAHPEVPLPQGPLQASSSTVVSPLSRPPSREANVQAAQVGVQSSILDGQ